MKILIPEQSIRARVADLGSSIARDYEDRRLTILGVLTGSIVLLADLIRAIDLPLRVGLIQVSSYSGRATVPGELTINDKLVPDLTGRDVLLVDDIFDTGRTIASLYDRINSFRPRSLRSAVLLWKENRCEVDLTPDYHGFRIPNRFVVGYGLDYDDEYRHLPYIAVLEEADIDDG